MHEPSEQLQVGESVYIDDGQIGARALERVVDGVVIEIVRAPVKGRKSVDAHGCASTQEDSAAARPAFVAGRVLRMMETLRRFNASRRGSKARQHHLERVLFGSVSESRSLHDV